MTSNAKLTFSSYSNNSIRAVPSLVGLHCICKIKLPCMVHGVNTTETPAEKICCSWMADIGKVVDCS